MITIRPIRRLLALVATAAAVVSAGSCSGASEKTAETRSDVAATASPAAGQQATTGSAPPAADAGQVVASTTGQQPADPNDEQPVPLRLDIRSAKRLPGDTVQVRFAITNTSDTKTYEPWSTLSDPTKRASYDVGGVALLDRPGDRKYLTLYSSDGRCLCSEDMAKVAIAPGKTAEMYADVTAPPASVTTVDLMMPGFAPIAGLRIQ